MTPRSSRRLELLDSNAAPEAALLEVAGSLPAPAFLDSTLAGTDAWTILTALPSGQVVDGLPDWAPSGASEGAPDRSRTWDPTLSARFRRDSTEPTPPDSPRPPFRTGWIGFLTYESASRWNRDFVTREREPGMPLAGWNRYEASLAYHHADRTWWLSHAESPTGREAASALRSCLARAAESSRSPGAQPIEIGPARADVPVEQYLSEVRAIREWIARGHIYQANLTYRVRAPYRGRGVDLYPHLRRTSPVPFGAYLRPDLGEDGAESPLEILAASPELFLSLEGGRVRTRPIKGTRPRDLSDPGRDAALARELFTSAKDRAELTMIVDLERNDLGRICHYGSVKTSAFPRVESYRGVHHLVADVEGQLRPGTSLADILAATFPGGSITGAPKIRAMELIRDIETSPRGIYTGALGYLDDAGWAVLSLTIRTLWITGRTERELRFGVGGGIVTDSVPEFEWAETEDKARTLLEALASGREGSRV